MKTGMPMRKFGTVRLLLPNDTFAKRGEPLGGLQVLPRDGGQ
jgi:hypothetical protein